MRAVERIVDALLYQSDRQVLLRPARWHQAHPADAPDSAGRDWTVVLFAIAFILLIATVATVLNPPVGTP